MLVATFYVLVGIFILIVSMFFLPVVRELFKGPQFLLPFIVFSLLGMALMFLTLKKKVKGKLKKFLILTGASSAGFLVSISLHNFLYGAAILVSNIEVLKYFFEALHVAFFIIAIFVCPLGFLIGVAGSVALFTKKRKEKKKIPL